MISAEAILTAAERTIAEGTILHVRAEALPGRRHPKREPLPAADLTLGPDARGGFLVVDYVRVRSGEEERHDSTALAVRAVRRRLGWDRLPALSQALVAVHGREEQPSRVVEEARLVEAGERLRGAFGHRPGIVGPLFGPGGVGRV